MLKDSQINYLKKKVSTLEEKNKNLESENKSLRAQLSLYLDSSNEKEKEKQVLDAIASAEKARNEYESLNAQLKEKITEANKVVKQGRALLNNQAKKFEKEVNKEIKNITTAISK